MCTSALAHTRGRVGACVSAWVGSCVNVRLPTQPAQPPPGFPAHAHVHVSNIRATQVRARASVRACACASERACVRLCARACACVHARAARAACVTPVRRPVVMPDADERQQVSEHRSLDLEVERAVDRERRR
eukprot:5006081-Pleurochrysis_carterae.AAC.1